ncbi:hypothetical protein ACVIGB_008618 [Bradyrhizobium sp. USDA 4341]
MRGWTPTSLAIDRVLRPSAANRTIRARFKSRCIVTGERQQASSTLRSFFERCFRYHPYSATTIVDCDSDLMPLSHCP